MGDLKFLVFSGLAVAGLAYCLWKTQADWRQSGFGWRVMFGAAACLSAFFSVGFLLTASLLKNL